MEANSEIIDSVVERIVDQFNIKADDFVQRLAVLLSKNLSDKLLAKVSAAPIPQKTEEKADTTKVASEQPRQQPTESLKSYLTNIPKIAEGVNRLVEIAEASKDKKPSFNFAEAFTFENFFKTVSPSFANQFKGLTATPGLLKTFFGDLPNKIEKKLEAIQALFKSKKEGSNIADRIKEAFKKLMPVGTTTQKPISFESIKEEASKKIEGAFKFVTDAGKNVKKQLAKEIGEALIPFRLLKEEILKRIPKLENPFKNFKLPTITNPFANIKKEDILNRFKFENPFKGLDKLVYNKVLSVFTSVQTFNATLQADIKKKFDTVFSAVGIIAGDIKKSFDKGVVSAFEMFNNAQRGLAAGIGKVLSPFTTLYRTLEKQKLPTFENPFKNFNPAKTFDDIKKQIVSKFASSVQSLTSIGRSIKQGFKDTIANAFSPVGAWIQSLRNQKPLEGLKGMFEEKLNSIKNYFNKLKQPKEDKKQEVKAEVKESPLKGLRELFNSKLSMMTGIFQRFQRKSEEKKDTAKPEAKESPLKGLKEMFDSKLSMMTGIFNRFKRKAEDTDTKKDKEPKEKKSFGEMLKGPFEFLAKKLEEANKRNAESEPEREKKEERDKEAQIAAKPTSFIETKNDKSQLVKFDGFTQHGFEEIQKHLPEILKKSLADALKGSGDKSDEGMVGPGLTSLFKFLKGPALRSALKTGLRFLQSFAGIAALLYGLETDGPFKGAAKIISKVLLTGESWFGKVVEKYGVKIVDGLIGIPRKLIKSFGKIIGGIFGKQAGKETLKVGAKLLRGTFGRVVGGLLKSLEGVPFVGSLISIGFAVSRFMQGDIVGGGLEIISAIVSALPIPGASFISYAIDGLNAFLDYKAGGTPSGGGKSKGGMILGWVKDLGKWLSKKFTDNVRKMPIIGPLFKAFDEFKAGRWMKGLKQLMYVNPLFDIIGEILGDTESTGLVKQGKQNAFKLGDMFKHLTDSIFSKVKEWWKSLNSGIKYVFSKILPKDLTTTLDSENTKQDDANSTVTPKAEAKAAAPTGALTTAKLNDAAKPETAPEDAAKDENATPSTVEGDNAQSPSVEQTAQPEVESDESTPVASVAPAESEAPAVTPQAVGTSDESIKYLDKIAQNSDTQTTNINNLVTGFNRLAKALEVLGVSAAGNKGDTTVINNQSNGGLSITSSDAANMGDSSIRDFRSFMANSYLAPATMNTGLLR